MSKTVSFWSIRTKQIPCYQIQYVSINTVSEHRLAFTGGKFFDGQLLSEELAPIFVNGRLATIENKQSILSQPDTEIVQLAGEIFTPGFVDLQINGGGGILFNTDQSSTALETIVNAHKQSGTVGLLPTLISDTAAVTQSAVAAVIAATTDGTSRIPGVLGLHLEGPHLSLPRKGAHSADMIRPMLDDDLSIILEAANQLPVLMVTIAPENVTLEQATTMVNAGAIVSLGHTDTDFNTAVSYFDAGVSCVTHLFNAMSQLTNREPGTVGAALSAKGVNVGLIADGIHVHPANIKLAWDAKTEPGRMFLVSDAMAVAGTNINTFTLNDRKITRNAGRLELEDGTLAGADLEIRNAARLLHEELHIDLQEVLKAAIATPREIIGIGSGRQHYRVEEGAPLHEFIRLDPESWSVTTFDGID